MIVAALDAYRDTRDLTQEWLFKTFYDHTWMKSWWHEAPDDLDASTDKTVRRRERARARRLADQGGFAEAVVPSPSPSPAWTVSWINGSLRVPAPSTKAILNTSSWNWPSSDRW
jgi:hypothetical protein